MRIISETCIATGNVVEWLAVATCRVSIGQKSAAPNHATHASLRTQSLRPKAMPILGQPKSTQSQSVFRVPSPAHEKEKINRAAEKTKDHSSKKYAQTASLNGNNIFDSFPGSGPPLP